MIRRLILLNLALVALMGFGAVKFRRDWQAFDPAHQVSAIQPKPENLPTLPAAAATSAAVGDWTEIPTHNPFSFDRNDIAILAPAPEPPKAIGPKPLLFGTMTLGQGVVAMLASGQSVNRNSRPYKVGESIDGWTVVEISDKEIVIEGNSGREKVDMNSIVQVPRVAERTSPASGGSPVVQSVAAPVASSSAAPSSAAPASSPNSPSAVG